MNLEEKVMEQMKQAMKSKDSLALDSLRAIKSALLLEKSSGKSAEITTETEIEVLQRLVKQRKESARQFREQNRIDLAENEEKQAEVIASFLPKQLSAEELLKSISQIIQELGVTSLKEMGKAIGEANKQLKGKASGEEIAKTVKSILGAT